MTMTAKRLAELDAVMAKATLGHWHVFQCVQLEGDTLFQLEARVEPDTLQCVSTDIAGEDDAAAIVALHNAYPDMRAHIDAQAATIARVIGAAKSLLALCEQAGLADDLLATIYPDSKNRSGQTRDETAKQARRTMNEARAAIAEAAGAQ